MTEHGRSWRPSDRTRRYCVSPGRSNSTGANMVRLAGSKRTTHGESKTRLYRIWCHIRNRCFCKSSSAYPDYGGRGVSICEEWSKYESFRDWAIANGYQDGLEIDRKDSNKNYAPENCRWATRCQQMHNTRKRRDAKHSKFKGVSKYGNRWIVQFVANGTRFYVGRFDNEEEAARAYDKKSREVHGEFALLNFKEEG